jgi:hypothetical protein
MYQNAIAHADPTNATAATMNTTTVGSMALSPSLAYLVETSR